MLTSLSFPSLCCPGNPYHFRNLECKHRRKPVQFQLWLDLGRTWLFPALLDVTLCTLKPFLWFLGLGRYTFSAFQPLLKCSCGCLTVARDQSYVESFCKLGTQCHTIIPPVLVQSLCRITKKIMFLKCFYKKWGQIRPHHMAPRKWMRRAKHMLIFQGGMLSISSLTVWPVVLVCSMDECVQWCHKVLFL